MSYQPVSATRSAGSLRSVTLPQRQISVQRSDQQPPSDGQTPLSDQLSQATSRATAGSGNAYDGASDAALQQRLNAVRRPVAQDTAKRDLNTQQLQLGQRRESPAPATNASSAVVEAPVEDGTAYPMDTFLRESLYMWTGTDSTEYFYFDHQNGQYRLRGGSRAQHDMFLTMRTVGATVRRIDELIRSRSTSFLQQSLKAAVRKQLIAFFYFVSALQERSEMSFPALCIAALKVQSKLHLLLSLLVETEDVKGGELATRLEAFHRQGSQRLGDLMSDIYSETMRPLLQMTVHWLTRGETPDPFLEFFVTVDDSIKDTDDTFWTSKYSLRPDMLPVNISLEVSKKIMTVAKNITFIRRCCRAKDWSLDPALLAAAQEATFRTLPQVVDEALNQSNTATMRLLREKLNLTGFIEVIRSIFLVGDGDLYEVLISALDGELSQRFDPSRLTYVRDAFRNALASVRHPHKDILGSVDCVLEPNEHTVTGWDAFSLTMIVPPPLNTIIDSRALRHYRRLLRMLLTVKRAEVSLKGAWRQSVLLDRRLICMQATEAKLFVEVAGDAQALGRELMHFVNNLWSYLVFEVNMAAYGRFKRALRECHSVDEVRAAHINYIEELRQYSLLAASENSGTLRASIERILTLCRRYCSCQLLLAQAIEQRGDPIALKDGYQRISHDFHIAISSLLQTLEEQNLQFDFMNFLLLRLNFNHYYDSGRVVATLSC